MKESISMTAIFQIVILFILLFTAIMALTINNSNAIGVKDEIVNILELNGGKYLDDSNENLNEEIVDLLANTSYRTTGKCPEDEGYIGFERNGSRITSNQDATVCIREVRATEGVDNYLTGGDVLGNTVATDDFVLGSYYEVIVFFQMDLPIIRQIYNFQSKAQTKVIYQD